MSGGLQHSKAFWGLMFHPSILNKGLDYSQNECVSKEETIGEAVLDAGLVNYALPQAKNNLSSERFGR